VRVAGIGNVSAAICHEQSVRRAVSLNGILGGETRPIREFTYPWIRDSLLVMHSDGLASSWSLATYPGTRGGIRRSSRRCCTGFQPRAATT
jgi:hypothetical protein